jgi:type IV pilus assembly protein PilM
LINLAKLFSGKKGTLGIDIGASSIKLVEIGESSSGYVLNHIYYEPLSGDLISDLSEAAQNELVDRLKYIVKQSGTSAANVVTSLPGHSVIVKKSAFPPLERKELRELIHDEADKYLPIENINDVYFDFQILGENESAAGMNDVLLVAAKKEIIETYISIFKKAGLKLVVLDVDTFALETMFEANYEIDERDTVFIINIGASITNINVIKQSGSIFSRDFSLGGNSITEAISHKLAVSPEQAEQMKRGGNDLDLLEFAEPIMVEIERSVDYFRSAFSGEYIKQILLSGGSGKIKGFCESLMQRLSIETEIANPFRNISLGENLDPAWIHEMAPLFCACVGLGLRRKGDKW